MYEEESSLPHCLTVFTPNGTCWTAWDSQRRIWKRSRPWSSQVRFHLLQWLASTVLRLKWNRGCHLVFILRNINISRNKYFPASWCNKSCSAHKWISFSILVQHGAKLYTYVINILIWWGGYEESVFTKWSPQFLPFSAPTSNTSLPTWLSVSTIFWLMCSVYRKTKLNRKLV